MAAPVTARPSRKASSTETSYEQMYLAWLKSLADSLAKLGFSQKEIRGRIPRGHPLGPALVAHISRDAQPNARRLANAGATGARQARRSADSRPPKPSQHPMAAQPKTPTPIGRGVRELDEVVGALADFMSAILTSTLKRRKRKKYAMGLGMGLQRERI